MALLCLAAQGKPYGYVTVAGKPPERLALLRLACPRGTRPREFDAWLAELERNGVVRRTEDGTIFSVRMVRDAARLEHAKKAATKRNKKANHEPMGSQSRANHEPQNLEKTRGNGRSNVAGATTEAEAEASYLSQEIDKMLLLQESGEQRVVRNGARAAHPILTEAKGSDDYLHNLLQTIQANRRPT